MLFVAGSSVPRKSMENGGNTFSRGLGWQSSVISVMCSKLSQSKTVVDAEFECKFLSAWTEHCLPDGSI